jgi:hypothetical protein
MLYLFCDFANKKSRSKDLVSGRLKTYQNQNYHYKVWYLLYPKRGYPTKFASLTQN